MRAFFTAINYVQHGTPHSLIQRGFARFATRSKGLACACMGRKRTLGVINMTYAKETFKVSYAFDAS